MEKKLIKVISVKNEIKVWKVIIMELSCDDGHTKIE